MDWLGRQRVIRTAALLALAGAALGLSASIPDGGSDAPADAARPPMASGPTSPSVYRSPTPGPPTGPPVRVVVPGRPGDPARVVSSDLVAAPDGSAYNGVDAWFVRMMIPHHAQALQLAGFAPGRTSHPGILALAGRIRAGQAPEIHTMRAWLKARGLPEMDAAHAGHDHASMPGMQSPRALRALAAARGAEFDRLFVTMMSAHHQGAVDMAVSVAKGGRDQQVEELSTGIAAEQAVEINRMRQVLAG